MSERNPSRRFSVLTGLLTVAVVLTGVVFVVDLPPAPPTPSTSLHAVPSAAPETTVPAAVAGTVAPPGSTRLDPAPPATARDPLPGQVGVVPATTTRALLPVKDEDDIRLDVAPAVATVSTRNGRGSGVLIASGWGGDGLVVTNAHVVWPEHDVDVRFPGEQPRRGTVVGVDAYADLAVIRIDGTRLPDPVPLGSPAENPGADAVFIVGYPVSPDVDPVEVPEVAVVPGVLRERRAWPFSGVDWAVVDAPAVGGQSGGALVDRYGRLVGITTFGTPTALYAVAADDLRHVVDRIVAESATGSPDRRPPDRPSARTHEVRLSGPWDQAVFVAWLGPGSESNVTSVPALRWRAVDPFGLEAGEGTGALRIVWALGTPGVVLGEADAAVDSEVTADVPLVRLDDPDDGHPLTPGVDHDGFVDVPGDRDHFILVIDGAASLRISAESHTRLRIALHDTATDATVATAEHERGFLFPEPALQVDDLAPGEYVVTVEDIGAQFGAYRLAVDLR